MIVYSLIVLFNAIALVIIVPQILRPNGVTRRGLTLVAGISAVTVAVYGLVIGGAISEATLNQNIHYLVFAMSGCCLILAVRGR